MAKDNVRSHRKTTDGDTYMAHAHVAIHAAAASERDWPKRVRGVQHLGREDYAVGL